MFPQTIYTSVRNRPEFNQPGVYLLFGSHPEGEGDKLYIGEGDPVRPRFEDHFANKDWWTQAVFFVAGPGQLNKAHVEYLEAQLYSRASAAKRTTLDNSNKPSEPTLSEAERAGMDVFLYNILGILPVLGIHAFEQSHGIAVKGEKSILTCRGRGVTASGYETSQGFVVQSGSYAANDEVPSLIEHFDYICQLRAKLTKNEVLVPEGDKLRFTIDYTFNSPSMASSIILGHPSNGRTNWKDSTGKTLKELQEAQVEN